MNQKSDGGAPSTEAVSPGETPRETTIEELAEMVRRLRANEPYVRCREVEGPLSPLATELNHLALSMDKRRTLTHDPFGVEVLVSQSPIMMMTCGTDACIRFLNYNVPGLDNLSLLGTSLYDLLLPDQVERVRGFVHRVLTTGEPVNYEINASVPTGPDWYTVTLGPIRASEQIIGFTLSMMDITDLKRAQSRLEQSNRELESFASVASHDLQEPLRKIQTFSERLRTMLADTVSPEARDYLERMNNAAARMRTLINDLLSFSRVSSKAQPFVRVNLQRIAHEVVGDLETAIEQSGASVKIGELPVLEADPMQMRQLLQNLLSNALKFRRDSVTPSIRVHGALDAQSRHVELKVEDNGIGFEEKYVDRIFQLFQRLHVRGQYEGTGIGLAICRKIAERHGGSIQARSTPDQGSTFIVTLPLKQTLQR